MKNAIISNVGEVLRRRGRHWQVVHEPLRSFLADGGDYQWLIDDPESLTSGGGNAFSWRSVGHETVHVFFDIGRRPYLVARIKATVLLEVIELLARARRVRERREKARRDWELHHEEWERKWAEDARRRRRAKRAKKER